MDRRDQQQSEKLDMYLHLDEIGGLQYAYLSIRPNTRINDPGNIRVKQHILDTIAQLTADSRIKHGLLTPEEIAAQIETYLAGYRQHGPYQDYFTFQLAAPTLPVKGEDSRLELLIDLELKPGRISDGKTGKIDYHDLGFSDKLVTCGQKIAILSHATPGIPGQTIFGDPVPPEPGTEVVKLKFDQKSIAANRDETANRTILTAVIDGFLYHDQSRGYFIDPDVLVNQVDFSTGNITVKDYTQIETSIKVAGSSNILKDSVKPGFTLKAREINIQGNVGRGAILEGEVINIKGIVDPEAKIIGQEITIDKVVGGDVRGDKIHISEVVRNASVEGRLVVIKNCLSSELKGREVLLTESMHSGTVTAEALIYCHGLQSVGKSTLRIDPLQLNDTREEEEEINRELQKLNRRSDLLLPQLTKKRHLLSQLESEIGRLFQQLENRRNITLSPQQRAAIRQLISRGKIEELGQRLQLAIPSLTRKRLLSYHRFSQEIGELQEQEEVLSGKLQELQDKLTALRHRYTQGLILLDSNGDGEGHISFGDHQLPPYRVEQPILFSFSRQRNKIIATLTPAPVPAKDRRLRRLSPEALQVINRYLEPAAAK